MTLKFISVALATSSLVILPVHAQTTEQINQQTESAVHGIRNSVFCGVACSYIRHVPAVLCNIACDAATNFFESPTVRPTENKRNSYSPHDFQHSRDTNFDGINDQSFDPSSF
jgi:hypothetical protein